MARLVIHHGGLGGRCLSLRGAGAGTGCRVLRLRSPSAAHTPTATGWRSRVPRQSRAYDCSAAAAAESRAGGGVSLVETPGLGAAKTPGLLPCGCLSVPDRGSSSSLIALLTLGHPEWSQFLPTWDTLFPEEERRPRVSRSLPALGSLFLNPRLPLARFQPQICHGAPHSYHLSAVKSSPGVLPDCFRRPPMS